MDKNTAIIYFINRKVVTDLTIDYFVTLGLSLDTDQSFVITMTLSCFENTVTAKLPDYQREFKVDSLRPATSNLVTFKFTRR